MGLEELTTLPREVLRDRRRTLVAETCAWAVGLSDRPHYTRRDGRLVPSGDTVGVRAGSGRALADEGDRLDLGDARPGTLQDALGALTPEGRLYADLLDEQVLVPFVLETCVVAAGRAQRDHPEAWAELLDELGEDGDDLEAVARAAEWDVPLRIEAEQAVLAALGHVPLSEVEAEGLPLSLVRAAERLTATAAAPRTPPGAADLDGELAGALFLAERALDEAELPVPVTPPHAGRLTAALLAQGLEPDEVLAVLPHLPVHADTADAVAAALPTEEEA